jgi:hypothetical protein
MKESKVKQLSGTMFVLILLVFALIIIAGKKALRHG